MPWLSIPEHGKLFFNDFMVFKSEIERSKSEISRRFAL
jgi:hypothetical protein